MEQDEEGSFAFKWPRLSVIVSLFDDVKVWFMYEAHFVYSKQTANKLVNTQCKK